MRPKKILICQAIVILSLVLLLSACNMPANSPSPVPTANPTASEVAPTLTPVNNTGQNGASVTVDLGELAQNITSQIIPAVPFSPDRPWWEVMPQYTLLTLQGYPIASHLMKPQIFVYPVKDLEVNEVAGKIPDNLQTLLKNQQVNQVIPYLPPYNAGQVMHAQVKFLDFKNGIGVRFLTQFDQAVLPVNNHELHYTCQGLTSDGKYYLAVVLPVNLPSLPIDENVTDSLPPDFYNNFTQYLADTVNMLNMQAASAFTPDLSKLDAMVQSIEIK